MIVSDCCKCISSSRDNDWSVTTIWNSRAILNVCFSSNCNYDVFLRRFFRKSLKDWIWLNTQKYMHSTLKVNTEHRGGCDVLQSNYLFFANYKRSSQKFNIQDQTTLCTYIWGLDHIISNATKVAVMKLIQHLVYLLVYLSSISSRVSRYMKWSRLARTNFYTALHMHIILNAIC